MKVLITGDIPEAAEKLLIKNKIEVEVYKQTSLIPRPLLIKKVKDVDAVITLITDKIDKEIIDAMTNVKVIANYAVGYNNIDFVYAKSKGIYVTNTPGVLSDATADLALALMLACARRICEAERFLRNGKFKGLHPKLMRGIELRGKRVGIIGAGRIGLETAKRIKAFGTNIVYYNRSKKPAFEKAVGGKKVSLNQLLKISDIISIHVPLNNDSFHLLNKENLKLLKPSAILINTARGEVIDEKALIELLKKKKIFAVGMDVFENEPIINKDLLKFENVTVLPHIGSATYEARDKMAELAAKNVINVLNKKPPVTPV